MKINTELKNKLIVSNVIWAHSGIGKTYLYTQGRDDIIDFDIEYKGIIGGYLAFPDLLLDSNMSQENINNVKRISKILVDKLFDLAIDEARSTNKKLLVSDIRLLQEKFESFDIIISIPKEVYLNNTSKRNELSINSRLIVKEEIDQFLKDVPNKSKIFEVSCYLSELLPVKDESNIISKKEKQSILVDRFRYINKELSKLNY